MRIFGSRQQVGLLISFLLLFSGSKSCSKTCFFRESMFLPMFLENLDRQKTDQSISEKKSFLMTAYPGLITVTVPHPPSTVTVSPVFRTVVALRQPTTAGMPNSRATIAAWDNGAPMSVTIADTLWKATVQPMLVTRVTRISPSASSPM